MKERRNKTLTKVLFGVLSSILLAAILYAAASDGTIALWDGSGARQNVTEFEILAPTVGAAADLVPGTDNTNSLGTSSLRWDDIQTYDITVADDMIISGDITSSGFVSAATVTATGLLNIPVVDDPNTNLTSVVTGYMVIESGTWGVCIATGSAQGAFALVSSTSTVCPS